MGHAMDSLTSSHLRLLVLCWVGVEAAAAATNQSINSGTFASQSVGGISNATTDDPNYGITWAFMPDGYNVLQVASLNAQDENKRDVDLSSVYFHLYTRNGDPEKAYPDDMDDLRGVFVTFDRQKETTFIVHGWMSSEEVPPIRGLREEYIAYQDVNVIMLDWRTVAGHPLYLPSVSAARDVGEYFAQFIDAMAEQLGADLNRMHIVGMSLGAHLSGFAGATVSSGRVARITGLDPAGPGYLLSGPNMRLDPSDAQFVDVIHSAAGSFGHFLNLGHVDFYPNGGVVQPNCTIISLQERESCGHGRALDYFAESVGNNDFYGYSCMNYDELEKCACNTSQSEMMGEYVSTTASGVYYVQVNGQSPYARGPIMAAGNCGSA